MGEVEKRVMSEEERLEYIKNHPITPRKRPTGLRSFTWRGAKGIASRYGKTYEKGGGLNG